MQSNAQLTIQNTIHALHLNITNQSNAINILNNKIMELEKKITELEINKNENQSIDYNNLSDDILNKLKGPPGPS